MRRALSLTVLVALGSSLAAACGSSSSDVAAKPPAAPPATNNPPSSDPSAKSPGEVPGTPSTPITPTTPASCARKDVAHGAPVALFDAFTSDMKTITDATAKKTRVDKLLADVAAAGGAPLEDPKSARVIFLARGGASSGAASWKVAGSFDGWDTSKAVSLAQIADTDLFAGETSIAHGADSFEYKLLANGDTFVEDPLALSVNWDGIDRGLGVNGQMNGVGHPGDAAMDHGRLVSIGKIHATKLGDDRPVWIQFPAAYDDATSCKTLPSIVIHDGLESLTRGGFAKQADTLYASRPDLAAVLVFVGLPNQDVRMDQYTFDSAGAKGDDYIDFLMTDLWPTITKSTRVCGKPEARGISGASLGGLISMYGALEHSDHWGWVGSQSGSYFWASNTMITRAQTESKKPVRVYLDSGCPDDNCDVNDQLAAVLKTKGYDYVRITQQDAQHDWPYWRDRLSGLLTHFRDKQTVCD